MVWSLGCSPGWSLGCSPGHSSGWASGRSPWGSSGCSSGCSPGSSSGYSPGSVLRHNTIPFVSGSPAPARFPEKHNGSSITLLPAFSSDALGGGYSFVHRLLLDHLADATEHSTEPPSTLMTTHFEPLSS